MNQDHVQARSNQSPSHAVAHNTPSGGVALPAVSPFPLQGKQATEPPVQRKVGFEFETSNNIVKEDQDKVPLKAHVWDNKNGFWHIQNDDTKLEFVTEPFDDIKDISTAIGQMHGLIGEMVDHKDKDKDVYQSAKGAGWNFAVKMDIDDDEFLAAPQSTEGVLLKNIPEMIQEHYLPGVWKNVSDQAEAIIPKKVEGGPDIDQSVRGLVYAILSLFSDTLDEDLEASDMGPKQL